VESLLTRLSRARRENRIERQLRQFLCPKVLIVDEMGCLPMSRRRPVCSVPLPGLWQKAIRGTEKRGKGLREGYDPKTIFQGTFYFGERRTKSIDDVDDRGLTFGPMACIWSPTSGPGAHLRLNREPRENRGPARGCERGRKPEKATVPPKAGWEGAASRLIRKSEDLPGPQGMILVERDRCRADLEDEKGTSPDRFLSVRGFF